jgi:hypothetical protein
MVIAVLYIVVWWLCSIMADSLSVKPRGTGVAVSCFAAGCTTIWLIYLLAIASSVDR